MIEEKSHLRKKFKKIRDAVDEQLRSEQSKSIIKKLTELDVYKESGTVFVYVSFGSEVETKDLLDRVISDKKRLCVPLCDTQNREMSAIEIDDLSQLRIGAYGIPEPLKTGKVIDKNEIDLIIVPALAFDKKGTRLGYGGGYYDKFLSGFEGCSVGLAFSCCVAEKLPSEEFDCDVDIVICSERMK